jgi:hypothetical protein
MYIAESNFTACYSISTVVHLHHSKQNGHGHAAIIAHPVTGNHPCHQQSKLGTVPHDDKMAET